MKIECFHHLTTVSIRHILITSAICDCEKPDLPRDETQTGMINIVPGAVGTEAVVQFVCRGRRVLAVTSVVRGEVHVVPGRFSIVTFPRN